MIDRRAVADICARNAGRYVDPFPRDLGAVIDLDPVAAPVLAAPSPRALTGSSSTTAPVPVVSSWTAPTGPRRRQLEQPHEDNEQSEASACRETPQAPQDPDATAILSALNRGPVRAKELPTAAGLPEGRCRRTRDALAVAGWIVSTPNGWALR